MGAATAGPQNEKAVGTSERRTMARTNTSEREGPSHVCNTIHAATTDTATSTAPSKANTITKDELLSRAKAAIDAGDQSLHVAAEALALAQDDFRNATQREIASAVGKPLRGRTPY